MQYSKLKQNVPNLCFQPAGISRILIILAIISQLVAVNPGIAKAHSRGTIQSASLSVDSQSMVGNAPQDNIVGGLTTLSSRVLFDQTSSSDPCENFETGYQLGQELRLHPDWFYNTASLGPKPEAGIGVASSIGLTNGDAIFTWKAHPLQWNSGDTAASFDGVNDRLTIPNDSQINLSGPYTAKTIELWFNSNRLTGQQVLYEQGGETNGLNIFLDGTNLYAGAWTAGVGNWVSTSVITATTYHVTLVYSGTLSAGGIGTITGYLNGASFGSVVTSFGSIASHTAGIGIGGINNDTRYPGGARTPVANGDNFAGTIDEAALYNQALPPARILSHAQCGGNANCNYPVEILSDSPIAYWRLDEASGTTAITIGAIGSVVNGAYENGVLINQPGLIVAGAPDTSASFDGIDDRLNVPGHALINTTGPYAAKTVEMWFKANSLTDKQMLYEQGGDLNGLNLFLDGSSIYVGAWATSAGVTYSTWVTTSVSLGTSYHVTMVYSGTVSGNTGILTGYLNGASFNSAPTGFGNIPSASRGTGIGGVNDYTRYPSGPAQIADGNNFNGSIDEVSLYNNPLAPTRILSHAQCGVSSGCNYPVGVLSDSPIAYWRLDEASGTTAFSIGTIGNAVNGTYANGVLINQPGLILEADPSFALSISMDFQTDGSGFFNNDRVGWMISNIEDAAANNFGIQMDPGVSGYNIEGYWDDATGVHQEPSIVDLPALSPNAWYKLEAIFTKLTNTSARIDVVLKSLDPAGNPASVIVRGALPDTSALGASAPNLKYFKAGTLWPAYRNSTAISGAADNACYAVGH
jgi:hypothetical protein